VVHRADSYFNAVTFWHTALIVVTRKHSLLTLREAERLIFTLKGAVHSAIETCLR